MPPRLKPIPEATWLRLAALDPRCHISMWREDQWLTPGAGGRMSWSGVNGSPERGRRVWRVRIFPNGRLDVPSIIDAHEPHLADALETAIGEAERRGWNGDAR